MSIQYTRWFQIFNFRQEITYENTLIFINSSVGTNLTTSEPQISPN